MKPFQSFNDLTLPSSMREALAGMNFIQPTPVQVGAIPPGLEGRDIVGTAQTGTGKTAAFGIPMLAALHASPGLGALVLAPTRELAAQIHTVLTQLSEGSDLLGVLVVGGESFNRQAKEIDRGVDFIVATPGRLNDHLKQRTVDISQAGILVLDEVDRMLDMGFLPQLKNILRYVPKERQTMLFSATLPSELSRFVDTLVRNPVRVAIGAVSAPSTQVTEDIVSVTRDGKNKKLLDELNKAEGKTLIFARTKSRTNRLMKFLQQNGFPAVCLHGGRSQGQRKQALAGFRDGSNPIMVATDLAGRGLDIVDIDHVVNFDVPATREDYIHRIGRTGRGASRGRAVSFVEAGNRDEEKIVRGNVRVAARR